jgi:hypothetical protein
VQALMRGQDRPSYIPSRTFALALLDVIAPADAAGPKTVDDVRNAVGSLPDSIPSYHLTRSANWICREFSAELILPKFA